MKERDAFFNWLLSPLEPEGFFVDCWGMHPLAISRRRTDYYRGIFSVPDFERVIGYAQPTRADILVVDKGLYFNENFFNSDWTPNLRMIYKAYHQGYSVVLNHVEKRFDSVATFARRVETAFGHPAGVNVYLTPRKSQAFLPHYDTHSIFILQIEGSKRWWIYKPVTGPSPNDSGETIDRERLGEPVYEAELNPGDLLYVPQGFVHEARTFESSSLHLTVGLFPFNWSDLITSAVEAIRLSDPRFNEPLPIGLLLEPAPSIAAKERYHELLSALADGSRLELAIDHRAKDFLLHRAPLPDGHFTKIDALERISSETELTKRPGAICRVIERGQESGIQFSGNEVMGPAKIGPSLRFIASNDRFKAGSLPGLVENEKLVLVRRLLREGLLTVVE